MNLHSSWQRMMILWWTWQRIMKYDDSSWRIIWFSGIYAARPRLSSGLLHGWVLCIWVMDIWMFMFEVIKVFFDLYSLWWLIDEGWFWVGVGCTWTFEGWSVSGCHHVEEVVRCIFKCHFRPSQASSRSDSPRCVAAARRTRECSRKTEQSRRSPLTPQFTFEIQTTQI